MKERGMEKGKYANGKGRRREDKGETEGMKKREEGRGERALRGKKGQGSKAAKLWVAVKQREPDEGF